jgi:capsule polysaccharide export protein KpsE/RkpR
MARTIEADTVEIDEIQSETPEAPEVPEPAETEEPPRKRLDQLMRKVLARRDEVRATQQKLREIEIELRQAPEDKRTRFERMREAALTEYRKARAEAARTRNQLLNTLRMLPSRS